MEATLKTLLHDSPTARYVLGAAHNTTTTHEMFDLTDGQFQTVYNVLSFSLASMMASTLYFWLRISSVHEKFKGALAITGLVTFIAGYHYLRIFNSWTEAYEYHVDPAARTENGIYITNPRLTGKPFNDAYRYMDWLLTVPLLLIEIICVMKLTKEETFNKSFRLGAAAAVMICIGYPGELIVSKDHLNQRWGYWLAAMVPFAYVVYTLLVDLKEATEKETDEEVKTLIYYAQYWTVISWLTYPVVYILPMLGLHGATLVVGIQVGYCISDIISKCGVGILICNITLQKSENFKKNGLLANEAE